MEIVNSKFSALNLGKPTNGQRAWKKAVMMVGTDSERILQALEVVMRQQTNPNVRNFRLVSDYNSPNVSDKVIRIIHSYTDYVNRNIWKKNL